MLKSIIIKPAVAAVTIASAIGLASLGATGAYAVTSAHPAATAATSASVAIPDTSGASCVTQDTPWPCAQVYGNGDFIVQMNGWAHSTVPYTITQLHIELTYIDTSNKLHFIKNCGQFNLGPHANSPNCIWTPNRTEPTGDYRATVWAYNSSTKKYANLGTADVAVHP